MHPLSWKDIILDSAHPGGRLIEAIDALLENQRMSWKAFRDGEASLHQMRTKSYSQDGARIIIQANPGRHSSIHAEVDPVSIAKRPCFLCVENVPPEERGVGFGDLVLLPNPHPILRRHLTVPTREHFPQRLRGRVQSLLDLARAIGPDMLVLYNGAQCGASAPDHFHFQAGDAVGVPLLEEVTGTDRDDEIVPLSTFGRRMLVHRSRSSERVTDVAQQVLQALPRLGAGDEEPLINIIVVYRHQRYTVFFFPRAKHRPQCYFAEGDARISVSPAALEMAGIVVVADWEHFERVDERSARSIYEEVSLERERFRELAENLK